MKNSHVAEYSRINIEPCNIFKDFSTAIPKPNSNAIVKVKAETQPNVCNKSTKGAGNLVINVKNIKKDDHLKSSCPLMVFFFVACVLMIFFLRDVTTLALYNIRDQVRENLYGTAGTTVLVYDGKQKYVTWPDPPPHGDLASVARYVMHISEFGSLATNSSHKGIEGYPFANIFSVSDGPYDNSTGVPYFYLTPLELSVLDIEVTNKVSLTVTEAQSNYCNKNGYDPEDPRCAHIILTGSIAKIEIDSEEGKFAKDALFSRHVEMQYWPEEHEWFFAKLDIIHIYLLDYFGGFFVVSPEDYYAANPFGCKKDCPYHV